MRRLAPVAAVLACIAAPSAHAGYLDPATIDTPAGGETLLGINDIAIAPDGTGALVFQKTVGGDDRVYVSVLAGGAWGAATRLDPDDGDDEAAPRVAAANGGRVLVGYSDGNKQFLRYRLKQAGSATFDPEAVIRDAAAADRIQLDWDLDMNPDGVAYAAWAEKNPAQTDARAWRLDAAGIAQLVPAALEQDPATQTVNDGGNGPDIRVAVDGAGNGTVLFGQTVDLTFVRRLTGVTPGALVPVDVPSVLGENRSTPQRQLDLDVAGNGLAWATGNAQYTAGGHSVGVPVVGETAGAPATLDAYPASENDGTERPDVALNATGQGLFTTEPNQKAGVFGGSIDGSAASPAIRLDTTPHDPAASEIPVTAIGDSGTGLVAWTRDVENSGGNGPFELRGRLWNGTAFEAETLMAADAKTTFPLSQADGAGASRLGDVAVLAEREVTGTKSVIVARFDAPPTAPTITSAANATTFSWSASEAIWSPLASYTVIIDEATVATLGPGELTYTATGLAPGDHTWRIVAADTLGQQAASPTQTLTIPQTDPDPDPDPDPTTDTTPPLISNLSQSKKRWRVGRGTRFRLTLSEPSTLTIAFRRLRPGRRLKSGRCVKPRRSLRRRPRCVRPKRVGTLTRANQTGQLTIRFTGRLNGRALALGRYEARFSAVDAAGNRSTTQRLRFRIVR